MENMPNVIFKINARSHMYSTDQRSRMRMSLNGSFENCKNTPKFYSINEDIDYQVRKITTKLNLRKVIQLLKK